MDSQRYGGAGKRRRQEIHRGIRDLVNLSFDRFKAKVNAQRELLLKVLYDLSTRYQAVIVYPSTNRLSEHSAHDLGDLTSEMNDPSEMLTVTPLIQADLYRSPPSEFPASRSLLSSGYVMGPNRNPACGNMRSN